MAATHIPTLSRRQRVVLYQARIRRASPGSLGEEALGAGQSLAERPARLPPMLFADCLAEIEPQNDVLTKVPA